MEWFNLFENCQLLHTYDHSRIILNLCKPMWAWFIKINRIIYGDYKKSSSINNTHYNGLHHWLLFSLYRMFRYICSKIHIVLDNFPKNLQIYIVLLKILKKYEKIHSNPHFIRSMLLNLFCNSQHFILKGFLKKNEHESQSRHTLIQKLWI